MIGARTKKGIKWQDFVFFKEKITFMFGDTLSLDVLVLESIVFYEQVCVLKFALPEIPKKYPEKWHERSFDLISFSLTLSELTCHSIKGTQILDEKGMLEIREIDGEKSLSFTSLNFRMRLSCKYIMLGDFEPIKRQ